MCDPAQRIGTYAPSSGGGSGSGLLDTKNIDLVSLTTGSTTTDNFTIEGEPFGNELINFTSQTQNQTSGGGTTTFTGSMILDGITTPTSITTTTLTTSFITPATTLAVTSGTSIGGTLGGTALNLSNASTTTLASPILGTFTTTPVSYPATASWLLGRNTSSTAHIVFKNNGLGSATNALTFGTFNNPLLTINTTSVRIENQFQVNTITVPPKTTLTPLTISSGTLLYPFNFSTTVGFKRIVIHGIDIIKPGASDTPWVQVGSNNVYYGTANTTTYRGVTGGNNGSSYYLWTGGIPIWNSVDGGPMNVATDFYMEFQYLNNDSGYEVWAVTGASGQSQASAAIYGNWFCGNVYMNATSYGFLNCLRLNFPGGAPTSGYVNVLVF